MSQCICEFPARCGGSGGLQCSGCGGDLCICQCGGEAECLGCDECPWGDRDGDDIMGPVEDDVGTGGTER